MQDAKYPYHAKAYLGDFEREARLPREEEDFETQGEAREWLRARKGGTIEKHDPRTGWTLIASVLPDSLGSAFVA